MKDGRGLREDHGGNDGGERGAWGLWAFVLERGFHICMHRPPSKAKQTPALGVNEFKKITKTTFRNEQKITS